MPVYKLLDEMPYTELLKWIKFFESQPEGWKEDQRTYMIMRALGVKESAEKLFVSLLRIKQESEKNQVNDQAMPKGRILEMMLQAKNGDNDWKPFKGK